MTITQDIARGFSTQEGRKALVSRYGADKHGYVGVNDLGEKIILGITPSGIVETVYQDNGWIRENYYDKDGYAAGETYDGRWRIS